MECKVSNNNIKNIHKRSNHNKKNIIAGSAFINLSLTQTNLLHT